MSRINVKRKNCRDVFNAFLIQFSMFAGIFEFPVLKPTYKIPNRLIAFSKAVSSKEHDYWVHFFEDDYLFERLWRNPKKYLEVLKQYNGVILPDFSLYRDMPFIMQLWNIYRSRAIGAWLQRNDVDIIPNIRYADRRTFKYACDGISSGCVIAVGSYGNIKVLEDRKWFSAGLDYVIKRLKPTEIIVYGSTPDSIFAKYKDIGVMIHQFDSDTSTSMKKEVLD
ncbi:MAG: DUF4417 domain-containing protein [Eubacterium sp.]|nr:DUF4417 domain-containing protein [Eubacterium sp.]